MPEPLDTALAEIRSLLLDPHLTRAVAAGRRRGDAPSVVRAEVRPVVLRGGHRLQIVTSDGARPYTQNVSPGPEAAAAVDALLAEPFGNWHVSTAEQVVQLRVTKKGQAQVHRTPAGPAGTSGENPAHRPNNAAGTRLAISPDGAAGAQPDCPPSARPASTPSTAAPARNTPPDNPPSARPASTPSSRPDARSTGPDAMRRRPGVLGAPGVMTSQPVAMPHDRVKKHLLDPGDPIFTTIGGSAAKRRQVDAFLRALAATLPDPPPMLRVVDLGCGNAYLTFAAYRYLAGRGVNVSVVGVDVREDQRRRNTELAECLGCADDVRFVAGTILDAVPFPVPCPAASSPDTGEEPAASPDTSARPRTGTDTGEDPATSPDTSGEPGAIPDIGGEPGAGAEMAPDVVLALHACDTATDEALARAVRWGARWVLAAPCCHHDIASQLRRRPAPTPYEALTRHGILRERFADVLTDALRASLLRLHGYRVDVVEFVDSAHTPRNLLLRARRTGAPPTPAQRREYTDLVESWQITPALQRLLEGEAR